MILQWNFAFLFTGFITVFAYDHMQHISHTDLPSMQQGRGGRISSPKLRASLEQSRDFMGLEEDASRYDLLLLVKRAGKAAGFSSRMIELLDYYMSFTRDIDWEEGSSPIVYQSLSKTALDLGVSERQIQKLENALFDAGALTWHDSGNHRRYGQRDPESGAILYAYGVDLTPLAYLRPQLEQKLAEKKARDAAWMELKRQISWYRRQIKAMLAELEGRGDIDPPLHELEASYNEIAIQIRTHLGLDRLESLLEEHKALYEQAHGILGEAQKPDKCADADSESNEPPITKKSSSRNEQGFAHYKSTTQNQSDKSDTGRDKPHGFSGRRNGPGRADPVTPVKAEPAKKPGQGASGSEDVDPEELVLSTGLQHITLKQALNAASERLREHLPLEPRPANWQDFIEAAYRLKGELHISQKSWADACVTLGRTGAAICVLLTDQAVLREDDPVRKPAGYFNAMISRARAGELHLHKSVFGILKREYEGEQA